MLVQRIRDCLFADDVLCDTEGEFGSARTGDLTVVGIDTVRAWLGGGFTSVSFKQPGTAITRGASLGAAEGLRL